MHGKCITYFLSTGGSYEKLEAEIFSDGVKIPAVTWDKVIRFLITKDPMVHLRVPYGHPNVSAKSTQNVSYKILQAENKTLPVKEQ